MTGTDESPTDAELIEQHVRGDRTAFDELVRRHQDRLWAVALRTLGDREDAADALQDALLSAYRRADTFRGASAVTTWLHRIVVNACIDLRRRRTARPVHPLPDYIDPPGADDLGSREATTAVLALLRQLPTDQAAAVVLVDVEGYPVATAAEILGVPVGTVKSRCARARAALAALLRNDPAGGDVQSGTNVTEGTS
jgi:RNA polymerase sigma-70 factor (ECF subfamily)